jgi:hypothetical protein
MENEEVDDAFNGFANVSIALRSIPVVRVVEV